MEVVPRPALPGATLGNPLPARPRAQFPSTRPPARPVGRAHVSGATRYPNPNCEPRSSGFQPARRSRAVASVTRCHDLSSSGSPASLGQTFPAQPG